MLAYNEANKYNLTWYISYSPKLPAIHRASRRDDHVACLNCLEVTGWKVTLLRAISS